MWSFCVSKYCICLMWCFVCTMGTCVLVLLAKGSYAETNVLCKVLGTVGTTLMKLVQDFLLN